MGSAVGKALTLFFRCLAEVILEDRPFSMDAGVRIERDVARAVGIVFFFSCSVCSFYFAFFSRHSAVWNANLTNS